VDEGIASAGWGDVRNPNVQTFIAHVGVRKLTPTYVLGGDDGARGITAWPAPNVLVGGGSDVQTHPRDRILDRGSRQSRRNSVSARR